MKKLSVAVLTVLVGTGVLLRIALGEAIFDSSLLAVGSCAMVMLSALVALVLFSVEIKS